MRNATLDYFKVLLAVFVVGIHTSFFIEYSETVSNLLVDGIFRIAVPTFFLINGYFFYRSYKAEKTLHWLRRVTLLYIFWMLVYAYAWFRLPLDISEIFRLMKLFFRGYFHLWYVAALLGAALLSLWLVKKSLKFSITFILFMFVIGVMIQYAAGLHLFERLSDPFYHRNFLFFALPFFFIGILVNKYQLHKTLDSKKLAILAIMASLSFFGEIWLDYKLAGYCDFDLLASLILLAPIVFMLLLKAGKPGQTKTVAAIANGIYFLHVMILQTLRTHNEHPNSVTLTLLAVVVSVLITLALTQWAPKAYRVL